MEFFENVVSVTKDAFNVARKKTGEVVASGKQRIDIAAIETKRAKDFEALGKLYYNSVKNTEIEDAEIKALVDEITAKTEKINALREEINSAKNKRICPKCQAAVDDMSLYCNICGEKLEYGNE